MRTDTSKMFMEGMRLKQNVHTVIDILDINTYYILILINGIKMLEEK